MSMAINCGECPTCKGITLIFDDFSTYETSYVCLRCGYFLDYSIVWGENGKPVLDEDGMPKYKETFFEGGYGRLTLYYKGKNEVYSDGFNAPLTETDIARYRKLFNSGDIIQERSFLIARINGEFQLVFGSPDYEMALEDSSSANKWF